MLPVLPTWVAGNNFDKTWICPPKRNEGMGVLKCLVASVNALESTPCLHVLQPLAKKILGFSGSSGSGQQSAVPELDAMLSKSRKLTVSARDEVDHYTKKRPQHHQECLPGEKSLTVRQPHACPTVDKRHCCTSTLSYGSTRGHKIDVPTVNERRHWLR